MSLHNVSSLMVSTIYVQQKKDRKNASSVWFPTVPPIFLSPSDKVHLDSAIVSHGSPVTFDTLQISEHICHTVVNTCRGKKKRKRKEFHASRQGTVPAQNWAWGVHRLLLPPSPVIWRRPTCKLMSEPTVSSTCHMGFKWDNHRLLHKTLPGALPNISPHDPVL